MNSLNTRIKRELKEAGVRPNKLLGQHFLTSMSIYEKIVAALDIQGGDKIIEVGPGIGILTELIAKQGADLFAVEKDKDFIPFLKHKFKNQENVKILEGDILKFDPEKYGFKKGAYKIVGNIPYYLTSRLFRITLEDWPQANLSVFMIQKEVAQRIVAQPPHMSLLGVSVQYFAKPKVVSRVSKLSFHPVPKVDSAIVRLTPNDEPHQKEYDEKFFKVLKVGFAGKRKQLINNLHSGLKEDKQEIEKKLNSIGINSQRRAETLTIEEWQKITELFNSTGSL
ncbi:MAG: 16S rRNA (adenine(1518)-N(6)/adenine(1519)-N(6))-dimethyltransferase RsmA [Candidatus Paceibacterota bacterium]